MATSTHKDQQAAGPTVLRGVSFKQYARMTQHPGNSHMRMAYFDGTLEIMSPKIRKHERPSGRLRLIITTVADVLDMNYEGTGAYTFRRAGDGPLKGTGREADQSFYFGNIASLRTDRDPDLDAGDPPADLWVEVDNRSSSRSRLPTYARLGIPEVWQYRAESKKIRFLRRDGTEFVAIDRSLALPVLTPALVQEALRHGEDLTEAIWIKWLREWVKQFIARNA